MLKTQQGTRNRATAPTHAQTEPTNTITNTSVTIITITTIATIATIATTMLTLPTNTN